MVDDGALNGFFVATDVRAHKLPDFFVVLAALFPNAKLRTIVSFLSALGLTLFKKSGVTTLERSPAA